MPRRENHCLMKNLPTMPDRDALRELYDEAINQINVARGNDLLTTPWYVETGNAVFKAGCLALSDAINDTRVLRTVPAPAGGGKTSFAYAYIVALTRYAETRPESPYGCAFVVDQITKADAVYRDLNALLPDKVGIWTKDHDVNNKSPTRMKPEDLAARFTKDELRHKPVIVVTNKFYLGSDGQKTRNAVRNGLFCCRALTVVDERPDEAPTLEIALSEAEAVREKLAPLHPQTREHLDTLLRLMERFSYADPNKLYRPGIELDAPSISRDLRWFRTEDAQRIAMSTASIPGVDRLFSFGRALAVGRGCIATDGALPYFFGYETKRIIDVAAGTILLDATADIDGVSSIVDWREAIDTPPARYDNLEIIHVRQHTKTHLKEYFKSVDNRCDYASWMFDTIHKHMSPGERGLVVCKETLFKNKHVPNWDHGDPRFKDPKNYTEGFNWNLDGRLLCATHYGSGIGSNAWNEADVVFLFDEHFLPRRAGAGTTQGYRNHRVDEGALGSLKTINSKSQAIDAIVNGNALRWTMQMGLRGRGRFYDENGVCGKQRLVIGCDYKRFSANIHKLFPGVKTVKVDKEIADSAPLATKVIDLLRRAETAKITTKQLSKTLDRPWRGVSGKLLTTEFKNDTVTSLGWRYVQGLGRAGSYFERITIDQSALSSELPEDYGVALVARNKVVRRFLGTP
jgi:hypothetical protein